VLRFIRNITRTVLFFALLAVLAVFVLGTMFLQKEPLLAEARAPDAADVAATRTLVQNVRATIDGRGTEQGLLRTNTDQFNSAMRLGARFIPGFRGQMRTEQSHILGTFSVPVPWWDGTRWMNVIGRAPEFTGRFAASDIFVGDRSLPPGPTLALARIGANIVMGNNLGDTILNSASGMQIDGQDLTFALSLTEMGKNGVMRGAFGALKGNTLPTSTEIETYHVQIREAMEDGRLAQTGSFLPHLQFALTAAQNGPTQTPLNERYTAAILGLSKFCAAEDFALLVGRLVFDKTVASKAWTITCSDLTLNNRIDSRRHFLTSAALQAISNTGFAVSAGEFKELYDTISGAGGFDFTDMAANLSGVRMSNALMTQSVAGWVALTERLETENDVIVQFDDIPQIMTDAEFAQRFTNINSPAYREMIAFIEARIDTLELHQPR